MTNRPILFSGPMVRAIINGTKTQTRMPVMRATSTVNGDPWPAARWATLDLDGEYARVFGEPADQHLHVRGEPGTVHHVHSRIAVGDLLWVRETWLHFGNSFCAGRADAQVKYKADGATRRCDAGAAPPTWAWWNTGRLPWTPSIHMPRWASRLSLLVTEVRVQRLHSITDADVRAEGVPARAVDYWRPWLHRDDCHGHAFGVVWDACYPAHPWASNPWVWAYTFEVRP